MADRSRWQARSVGGHSDRPAGRGIRGGDRAAGDRSLHRPRRIL